jgi:hypothetical protein
MPKILPRGDARGKQQWKCFPVVAVAMERQLGLDKVLLRRQGSYKPDAVRVSSS